MTTLELVPVPSGESWAYAACATPVRRRVGLRTFIDAFVKDQFLPSVRADYRAQAAEALSSEYCFLIYHLLLSCAAAFWGPAILSRVCSVSATPSLCLIWLQPDQPSAFSLSTVCTAGCMPQDPCPACPCALPASLLTIVVRPLCLPPQGQDHWGIRVAPGPGPPCAAGASGGGGSSRGGAHSHSELLHTLGQLREPFEAKTSAAPGDATTPHRITQRQGSASLSLLPALLAAGGCGHRF